MVFIMIILELVDFISNNQKVEYTMRKNIIISLFTVFVFSFILIDMEVEANFKDEIVENQPSMKVYDGNFNLVESYSGKEVEQFYLDNNQPQNIVGLSGITTLAAPPMPKQYSFGSTQFKSNIWVKGGDSFYDLKGIAINPAGTIKKIIIEVYSGSTRVKVMVVENFRNGIGIPLGTANSSKSYHSILLRNGDPNGWTSISSGVVYYSSL